MSSSCNYSDAYVLAKRIITVIEAEADNAAWAADRKNKQVIFKNCAPFTGCITEINSTQVDIDVNWCFYADV